MGSLFIHRTLDFGHELEMNIIACNYHPSHYRGVGLDFWLLHVLLGTAILYSPNVKAPLETLFPSLSWKIVFSSTCQLILQPFSLHHTRTTMMKFKPNIRDQLFDHLENGMHFQSENNSLEAHLGTNSSTKTILFIYLFIYLMYFIACTKIEQKGWKL